jgi:hypothetical protein
MDPVTLASIIGLIVGFPTFILVTYFVLGPAEFHKFITFGLSSTTFEPLPNNIHYNNQTGIITATGYRLLDTVPGHDRQPKTHSTDEVPNDTDKEIYNKSKRHTRKTRKTPKNPKTPATTKPKQSR